MFRLTASYDIISINSLRLLGAFSRGRTSTARFISVIPERLSRSVWRASSLARYPCLNDKHVSIWTRGTFITCVYHHYSNCLPIKMLVGMNNILVQRDIIHFFVWKYWNAKISVGRASLVRRENGVFPISKGITHEGVSIYEKNVKDSEFLQGNYNVATALVWRMMMNDFLMNEETPLNVRSWRTWFSLGTLW